MKSGRQKAKGSAYERVVAKLFTEQFYPNGGGEFRRVPLSGGWDKRVAPGDLIALGSGVADCIGEEQALVIDRRFPFCVECKNYRDENVKHFFSGLYSNQSQMFNWMAQAQRDADISGKFPLVVFKLFKANHVCMTSKRTMHELMISFGEFAGRIFTLTQVDNGEHTITVMLFLLDDFFKWIDADTLMSWNVGATDSAKKHIM